MRRAALLLLALAACGKKAPPMTATCELGPPGEEVPQLLQRRPWLLHDLDVADDIPRKWHCVVKGRKREKVWSEEPALKAITDDDGVARLAFRVDRLGPELVLRWGDGSATLKTPEVEKVSAAVTVDGEGVAHIEGTVTGADAVTIAGEPVPVTGGGFTKALPLAKWVFDHATVADLPLDPLPSKLTMLVAAGDAHAMVTTPSPQLMLGQWIQGVLAEGASVPFAPPRDPTHDAPTVVVFWKDTPTLKALVRATTLGSVEVIAHVRDGEVTIYTAADGARLARKTFEDADELAITAWILDQVRASPPGAR